MNTNLICNTIGEISLYLDPTTLEQIKKFIDTFIGDAWQVNPKLYIYVCTAIVCECKKMPAVQAHLQVPFGLSIQKVMKYCTDVSKQDFLSTIISVAEKWPTCPSLLLHKLENLKLSFRVFKKFRLACKLIGQKNFLDPSINYSISSLFWLIYLLAKHLNNESESVQIMTTIMPLLIEQIYASYLQIQNGQNMAETITRFFNYPDLQSPTIKELYSKYSKQFLKIMNESYSRRYLAETTNFNFLIHKPLIIQRLIDDLSNVYAKVLEGNPQFSIDQMSFLELHKDMTPQAFHQKIDKNGFIISQRISFEGQRPLNKEMITPKKIPLPSRAGNIEETPLTARMQNLAWIRNCITSLQDKKIENVEALYKKYNTGIFAHFYEQLLQKIERVIIEFSPSCKDFSKRKTQIYKFFSYCINIAIQMYSQDIQKIFQSDSALFSISCLCTQIFNFVYQTYSGNYAKYCQIFEVDFVNAFWPINWFGYFIKLPKAVDDHLYELERKFLLKQIWTIDLGFKIITNHEEVVKINELRMLQRLQQHIKCRIDQICRQTTGERMVKKVYSMVMQLIQKKPILLQRNNIDQIIICSITACLSINEDSNKLSLEKIFSFYSRVSLSSQQNKEKLYDKENHEINIVDFYNNVFLEEVEEIIKNFPQTSTFLLTPKRLQLADKYKQGSEITPMRLKYKQNQCAFLKRKADRAQQIPEYQLNLAKNIKMERQAPMIDESEQSSIENENKSNCM